VDCPGKRTSCTLPPRIKGCYSNKTKEVSKVKVLVTGFGGWGGDPVNPALKLMQYFDQEKKEIQEAQIVSRELPIDTTMTSKSVFKLLDELNPDVYIAVGSAPGRSMICLERVGINILDFPIPDNAGHQPVDQKVVEEGPLAYYSTLPIKAIVQKLHEHGIPAKVSNTASTYICNQTLYTTLHYAATKKPTLKTGFIHVPLLPEQQDSVLKGVPSMTLELQKRAIELAIEVALNTDQDINLPGTCLA
jgi:pyroglutamyl-peptidase